MERRIFSLFLTAPKWRLVASSLDLPFNWLRRQWAPLIARYTQGAQLQRVYRSSRRKYRLDRAWGSSWRVWYRLGTQDRQCSCHGSRWFVTSEGWCYGWRERLAVRFARVQGNNFGILVRPCFRNCHYDVLYEFHCWSLSSHKVLHVGQLLFPLFALALDLPENFFVDKVISFIILILSFLNKCIPPIRRLDLLQLCGSFIIRHRVQLASRAIRTEDR